MNTIVPLISSGVAGPLGVLHLPRLWLKLSLESTGKLAPGYPGAGKGYDQMVIDGLGLDRDETLAYLKTIPTYFHFEQWILDKKGGHLDQAAVEKLNRAIHGYDHSDVVRKSILIAANVEDHGIVKDAVTLNSYDDWTEFHASLE